MECEFSGICFERPEDGQGGTTLFLAVQHPGEVNGTCRRGVQEIQAHQLVDPKGVAFEQFRIVPLGSNWPSGVPDRPPRAGIVAIRRTKGGPVLEPQGPRRIDQIPTP
jgi:secreted PhoX family phosphatase